MNEDKDYRSQLTCPALPNLDDFESIRNSKIDMNLTVYHKPTVRDSAVADPRMFFDINQTAYKFVTDLEQPCDIQLIELERPKDLEPETRANTKIQVKLDIFHTCEYRLEGIVNNTPKDCYLITIATSKNYKNHPNLIINDFIFNRTKAYYSRFLFSNDTVKWYWKNDQSYVIPEHPDATHKTKIYVAPNRTYLNNPWRTIKFRPRLVQRLLHQWKDKGYIGENDFDKQCFLISHVQMPECSNIQTLIQTAKNPIYNEGYEGYCPPHNQYYMDSFISIYAETIEHGPSIVVSEKTYDPLIKGHFILPFSCSGFVARLRELGFLFPDFINYSYDDQPNDEKRFDLYLQEMQRLLNLDIDIWRTNWSQNLSVITHNQKIFKNRPYDRVDFSKIL
jgi:hypothetical protein